MSNLFLRSKTLQKGKTRDYFPTAYKLFSINKNSFFMKALLNIIKKDNETNMLYSSDYPIVNSNYVSISRHIEKNVDILALQTYKGIGPALEEKSYTKWLDSDEIKVISDFLKSKFDFIWRCRINGMPQFAGIPWHIDSDSSIACRVYIPISANIDKKNLFEINRRGDITNLKMNVGECWFINAGFKHRVINNTDKKRFSLIFNTTSEEIEKWINKKIYKSKKNSYTKIKHKKKSKLHYASSKGNIELVKQLIKNKVDINTMDEEGFTPLHYASYKGHLQVVKALVKNGASINIRDQYKSTPLYGASQNGHIEIVKNLIKNGAKINLKNRDGTTAINGAGYKGHKNIVKLLLKKADKKEFKAENTVLHNASLRGHLDIVKLILKSDLNINIKNKDNSSALQTASHAGHKYIVKILIKHKADINIMDNEGWTAIQDASARGYKDIVEILIKNGANVNIKNKEGETALYHASARGYKDIVEILIKNGANVNIKNKEGETALYHASARGYKDIVEILIKNGANVNIKNKEGETALYHASARGYKDIVEILIKNGANVN